MSSTIIGASLPPMVEGQLRCFLSIKLGELVWNIPRPPKDIQVRIIWWGQTGNSAVLRPQVDTDPNYVVSKNKHAEVHYPIRCGPKQFEAYLKDMTGLHLDIVFGPSCTSFASVNIQDVVQVNSTQVLDKYYPLMCTSAASKGKEVGQLKITISFKSISDTYNISSSIIPTTDKEFQQPKCKKRLETNPLNSETEKQLPKKMAPKNKNLKNLNNPAIQFAEKSDNGFSADVDFVVGPGATPYHYSLNEKKKNKKLEIVSSNDNIDEEETDDDIAEPFVTRNTNMYLHETSSPPEENVQHEQPIILKGEHRATVLSSLLQKTQQLRNSMIQHTLKSDNIPLKSETDEQGSGKLFEELLQDMSNGQGSLDFEVSRTQKRNEDFAAHEMERLDTRVVDLLLGKEDNIEQLMRKVDMSLDSNFSSYSDDQDPLHDSSLLDDLLYTTKALKNIDESSILSLNESNGEELYTKEVKKTVKLNTKLLDTSCDIIPTREKEESSNNVGTFLGKCIEEDENTVVSITSTPVLSKNSSSLHKRSLPECVTVEKLTQLGRVKSVKVVLKEFLLCVKSLNYGCVYFVEYKFPVSTEENQTPLMEQVRQVSRCVNSVVDFGRYSVFPIIFNEEMVELWWERSIPFTLYVKYGRPEKAEWFGEGYFKLRDVLLNDEMNMNVDVDIYNDTRSESNNHKSFSPIGQLKMYVELAMEHSKSSSLHVSNKASKPAATFPVEKKGKQSVPTYPLTPIKINTKISKKRITEQTARINIGESDQNQQSSEVSSGNVFLQNLIVVSSGSDIVYSTKNDEHSFSNSYFVCRVFWNNGELKSKICWSTDNPNYGFHRIIPVTLTADIINKMENNFMIIEVWHKYTTTDRDKLIGMSKLPLHQFFLSFKDPHLAETILKSKYPVIANDGPVPVVNLFSGKEHGCLNVVFALGTHDQVTEVLQMKKSFLSTHNHKERSRTDADANKNLRNIEEGMVDHCFDITIENMKGLVQDRDEVWGESDCYVQYRFPEQNNCNDMKMTTFKTKTTLCLPNPVFRHTSTHSFYLERHVPLQKLLIESFQVTSSDVVFEIWKRNYYPNVRDQLIGKASFPLAKICAMVTMNAGKDSDQCFHLPVVGPIGNNEIDNSSNGILDVSVAYKYRSNGRSNNVHHNLYLPKELVCLSLSINRLCGLKDGLCQLSKKYKKLGSAARTGPNIFVKMYLSFIGKTSIRTTNVAAKSFSPAFSYHVDFPLPVKFGDDNETPLAELLEDGFIVCEVAHEFLEADNEDMIICSTKIPLVNILTHCTGIKGWWPLILTNFDEAHMEGICAGGIEVNAKFTNNADREKVINVARGMGWSPSTYLGLHDESWLSLAEDSECRPSLLNIFVDIVNIPGNVMDNLLCKYTDVKHRFETMYCRYKFYNKAPIYSKSAKVNVKEKKYYCSLAHLSSHEIIPNTSFAWYLREEQLEIQFWLSWSNYTVTDSSFTRQKDKLVGSIYVDMSSFSHSPYEEKLISCQFPLFNANCDSICNTTARVSVSFNTDISKHVAQNIPVRRDSNSADLSCISSGDDDDDLLNDICQKKIEEANESENDDENCEKVNIHIEEAMHLQLGNAILNPNIYVTYQLPNMRLIYTNLVSTKKKCEWNFQKQHKINLNILKGRKLIFSIWKCTSEKQNVQRDTLMGTSQVDTAALFVGMKQIIGWYNIQDLDRQIIGQIKLGIVPSISLASPMSSKYFLGNQQIRTFNLTTKDCFSNPSIASVSKLAVDNSCLPPKSILFQQLNSQLQELQEMTSHIQQRVYNVPNSQLSVEKVCNSSDTSLPRNAYSAPVPDNCNKHVDDANTDKMLDDTQLNNNVHCDNETVNTIMEEYVELPTEDLIKGQNIGVEGEESLQIAIEHTSNVTTLSQNAPANGFDQNTLLPEAHLEEDLEENEENMEHIVCDGNSSFGSTDELLDDLKKFEEKFTLIKDSLEKDNSYEEDSCISDVEVIDMCSTNLPLSNTAGGSDAYGFDINSDVETYIAQNMENTCANIGIEGRECIDFKVKEIDLAEQICLKSDDIEDGVQCSGNQSSTILPKTSALLHDDPKSELLDVEGVDLRYKSTTKDNNMDWKLISNEESTSSDSGIRSPNIGTRKNVELPNFFMRAEELAESMQALRVAAKLRQSPRTRSSFSGEDTMDDTSILHNIIKNNDNVIKSNSDKELQEKIRKTLPVEVSEMARIASIFSLKSRTK